MKPDPTVPPLAADDPRLSEWLDGRLPAAEAAEIARAVAGSPELSRLAADLRGIKKSLASLPALPPPATFVGDVMAALDARPGGRADDAAVEAEWRKIERERLEEEIAEARDDAAEPADEPMRHRWPWLALLGALAAGVLVAFVINRPLPGDREVALAAGRADSGAERRGQKQDTAKNNDLWLEHAAAHEKASLPGGAPAPATVPAPADASALDAAPSTAAAPAPDAALAQGPSGKAGSLAAGEAEAASDVSPVRVVRYRMRTAADRARLDALVAAIGNRANAKRRLSDAGVDRPADRPAEEQQDAGLGKLLLAQRAREGGRGAERIEVSGSAADIAALIATLEATEPKQAPEALRAGRAAAVTDGRPEVVRLIIEVIDESGAEAEAAEGGP
jgi:hypothetical protein